MKPHRSRIHGVLCHVRGALGCNAAMPRQRHYYGLNHLHFITASIPQGGAEPGCLIPTVFAGTSSPLSPGCEPSLFVS